MIFHSQVIPFQALGAVGYYLLRRTLRGAKCFRVALGVRLCAIPVVGLASLSALALLAAVLLSIPVDDARAHSSGTATHHAETYPLHEAVRLGDLTSVNHFIGDHGADVNERDRSQFMPLHWVFVGGQVNIDIVAALIAAGADVNAKTIGGGTTPLHFAASGGHVDIAAALLAGGANVNAKDKDDKTPLDLATENSRAAVYPALIAAGGYLGDAACESGFYDSAAEKCVAVAACDEPAVLNGGTNLCDCPSPNIGTDGAVAPGDCAVPAPSAEVCGGLNPAKFYDSAARECAAFAACAAPAVVNTKANLCDCPSPNIGTDRAVEPGDCAALSVESCGGLTPAQVLRFSGGGMRGVCGLPGAGGFEHGDEFVRLSDAECWNGRGGRAGRLRRAKRGKLRGIDSGQVLRFGGGGMRGGCGLRRAGGFERGGEFVRLSAAECWNGRGGRAGRLRRADAKRGKLRGICSGQVL